jgi:hypothetical protein
MTFLLFNKDLDVLLFFLLKTASSNVCHLSVREEKNLGGRAGRLHGPYACLKGRAGAKGRHRRRPGGGD